ncbi:MAG TPA: chemotaxis protein CheC [Bacillus bacterium]|nr:chemotaxis protein CheC [Bacillus sp. (in: firmicutes)]
MSFIKHIRSHHLDILKEVGNIGAGNAATALSKILGKKIDMNVPNVRIVSFDEMMDLVGGSEKVIASVFLRIEGDAPGSIYFMLPLEQARKYIKQMTGEENFSFENPPYSELSVSALQELGNILSGSYLSALSDFTKLDFYPSVPALGIDMVGAILSYGLMEVSQESDFVIVIDTAVSEDDDFTHASVRGHFFLLLDPGSFEKIFSALGVPVDE